MRTSQLGGLERDGERPGIQAPGIWRTEAGPYLTPEYWSSRYLQVGTNRVCAEWRGSMRDGRATRNGCVEMGWGVLHNSEVPSSGKQVDPVEVMEERAADRGATPVREARPRSWWLMCCALGLAMLIGLTASAQGRNPTEALEPRVSQFVFVIDDSGSMRGGLGANSRSADAPDLDRLAIFAVRALLSVLDEDDWATVVRLNGPGSGEPIPELVHLTTQHRQELLRTLDLGGSLAAYSGTNTPCATALQAVRRLFERAARPDVSRVVIFLTDGECTPNGEAGVLPVFGDASGELDKDLTFFLLKFEGAKVSHQLETLATQAGGATFNVTRGDPVRILNSFAQALARSQGYESQIVGPQDRELPGHRGARRVRLLAVAPGGGTTPLEIVVTRSDGSRVAVRALDSYVHRFEPDGREYRFAAAEYAPPGEPVNVEVRGAGQGWEVIALPEYRLGVEMELHSGTCGQEGAALAGDDVPAESDLCAELRLVSRPQNQVVGQDVTSGNLRAVLEVSKKGESSGGPIRANPSSGVESRFRLPVHVGEGYYSVRGAIELESPVSERPIVLPAGERTVQAVDRSVRVEPPVLDVGDLYPGSSRSFPIKLEGGFSELAALVDVAADAPLPACVRLTFADQPLGTTLTLVRGQTYFVQMEVAEDCPEERLSQLSTHLVLRGPDRSDVGSVSIPLHGALDNSVQRADPLEFDLEAGQAAEGELKPPGGSESKTLHYQASLALARSESVGSEKQLVVGFLDPSEKSRLEVDDRGNPVKDKQVALAPGRSLGLRIFAQPCCRTGIYQRELRLRPVEGGGVVLVPVQVEVKGSWWTCYRSWVLAGLVGLLAGLLCWYVLSMFLHTHLLSKEQLTNRLIPLRWPPNRGAPQPSSDRASEREEVSEIVNNGLKPGQRIWNWIRANPFSFGLPGKRYLETVRLDLVPANDLFESSITLMPERDPVARLLKADDIEEWEAGTLYARAGSAVAVYAAIGNDGRFGRLRLSGIQPSRDGGVTVEVLNKGTMLVHDLQTRDRVEGRVAGWMV